ncbi:VWA domain-containing protein [Granulicella cerasi]|uniref:VWA domain-containing protein n=1 Tax=Granulicella cerasi TaxID=741063 RepID=A0ABW1ZEM3_9BACT|nr:VWA domain-containing protein [Granulicella cerasi]
MRETRYNLGKKAMSAALCCAMTLAATAQEAAQEAAPQANGGYTLKINSNMVLTNVVVRDAKTGEVVKGLTAADFTISEDKKPQKISSFDFQNVDAAAILNEASTVSGQAKIADLLNNDLGADAKALKDHRLIVMFFDMSTMQDDDIDRAVASARDYVNKQMQPADLVAMVSLSTSLSMDQDFTSNKEALLRVLSKYDGSEDQGFANGTTGSTDGTSDDGSSFAADDSEFNSLNTDRELFAIRTIAKSLERVEQRKSMLFFSGGITRNGIENQASLRAATNAAARSNMAIYSVDARGLQALPPVGDATKGSLRGTAAYTGSAVRSQFNANFASQDTLSNLSTDTGGKAFFDSNNFAPAFQQVQHDTEAYYILGFRATNQKQDGTYRHLTVTVNRKGVKLEYRPGYYAPSDFTHQRTEDRELALKEAMRSDLPATDLPVYLQAAYLREQDGHFYVPVTLLVPGSAIPFVKNGNADKASIDIMGQVKASEGSASGVDFGNVRDTVKLAVNQDQQAARKNIQYSTGFLLAPGHYHVKFVVRENETGSMGSFETDLNVPDLKRTPLKLSSVIFSTQHQPNTQRHTQSLLVRDGVEWVPNVSHIVRQDQHLYFLYEVYDPTAPKDAKQAPLPAGMKSHDGGATKLLTSIEFLSNGAKVFETPTVTAERVNIPERNAVAFQFDVPATQLKPGNYICQVNVVDDAGGSFSFPRMALRVVASPTLPSAPAPATQPTPTANTPGS